MPDAPQLLSTFARTASPDAFRALVALHIDLVYAAARRQTHDSHDAEDITQAVFIVLAHKARTLPSATLLPAWLLKATHLAAINARRAATRRRQHEQEASAMLPTTAPPSDPEWEQLSPHLDGALARLSATDRAVIIAHCVYEQPFAQLAAELKLTEPAARKRVQRALERLRGLLEPHTQAPPPTLLALPALLTAHALTPAPAGLASTISTTALAALHGTAATGSALVIAKGVMHMMFLAKAKLALAATLAVSILFTITGTAVHFALAEPATVATTAPAPLPPTTAAAAPLAGPAAATSFGPVIERELYDYKSGKAWLLNLTTGETYTLPPGLDWDKKADAVWVWARQRGIHVTGLPVASQQALYGFEMKGAYLDGTQTAFETITPNQVSLALQNGHLCMEVRHGDGPVLDLLKGSLFAIKTDAGELGVLQITGFAENPKGVKIRYKLVKQPTTQPATEPATPR